MSPETDTHSHPEHSTTGGVHQMSIVDPTDNTPLGPQFTVSGTCDGLTANAGLTIMVTFTGSITITKLATTNPSANTWEAYFDEVPNSTGATLDATCDDGAAPPVTGLTVTGAEPPVEVEFPVNGQEFISLDGARASGTHLETHEVAVFATLGGHRLTRPMPVTRPTSGKTDQDSGNGCPQRHGWSICLSELVPNPCPGAMYGFHVLANDCSTNKRYVTSAGFFLLETPKRAAHRRSRCVGYRE